MGINKNCPCYRVILLKSGEFCFEITPFRAVDRHVFILLSNMQ